MLRESEIIDSLFPQMGKIIKANIQGKIEIGEVILNLLALADDQILLMIASVNCRKA